MVAGLYSASIIFSLVILIYTMGSGQVGTAMFWDRWIRTKDALVYGPLNQQRRQVVLHAVELYAQERGSYPEALTVLVERRFLDPAAINLLGAHRYSYVLRDGGYSLIIVPEEKGSLTASGHEGQPAGNHL